MSRLIPTDFLSVPVAHRAYHDIDQGRPENSRAAVHAACNAGYGIEIDLQLSADGEAMVFHDYSLDRLTGETGPTRQRDAAQLTKIPLIGGVGETIPTLAEVLAAVAGRVPVLIEIKDQDGAMGNAVGPLERRTAQLLSDYAGPVAVMSFNPNSVAAFAEFAPNIPRGLTTCAFDPNDWPLSTEVCEDLREIPDLERTGASFISHDVSDLDRPRVQQIRASGLPVLCWTIRSQQQEDEARKLADNITFEGYAASHPA